MQLLPCSLDTGSCPAPSMEALLMGAANHLQKQGRKRKKGNSLTFFCLVSICFCCLQPKNSNSEILPRKELQASTLLLFKRRARESSSQNSALGGEARLRAEAVGPGAPQSARQVAPTPSFGQGTSQAVNGHGQEDAAHASHRNHSKTS